MNGPELKVRLGGLGLSPGWFADHVKVTMRTVVRWFDGEQDVSDKVADELERLSGLTLDEMLKTIERIGEGTESVTLKTYRTDKDYPSQRWPASWHRALTFRVMEHLRAQGRDVTIVYA